MSKIKRIINYYLLHQYPDDVTREFADWFTDSRDSDIKDELLRQEWEAIDAKELELLAEKIDTEFKEKLVGEKYAGITRVSFGITRILEQADRNFEKLYSNADKALYVAKNRSKTAWYIL